MDIPDDSIPWTALAARLKNKRIGADYRRHWKVLKTNRVLGRPERQTREEATDFSFALIETLDLLFGDADDISEINWSDIDHHLFIRDANGRWRTLCKRFCNPSDNYRMCFEKIKSKLKLARDDSSQKEDPILQPQVRTKRKKAADDE